MVITWLTRLVNCFWLRILPNLQLLGWLLHRSKLKGWFHSRCLHRPCIIQEENTTYFNKCNIEKDCTSAFLFSGEALWHLHGAFPFWMMGWNKMEWCDKSVEDRQLFILRPLCCEGKSCSEWLIKSHHRLYCQFQFHTDRHTHVHAHTMTKETERAVCLSGGGELL